MRIMTEKEFDALQAIMALSTGCHMLRELCDDVRHDIPDEMQDSFIQLRQVLDDLRNPAYDYVTSHISTYIDK